MSIIEQIEKVLKKKGYKSTFSRKEIINCFIETNKHLKPEEIYSKVQHHGISLPTVYRNLEMLKENEIISELCVNGERLYELRIFSNNVVHIHYKCTSCGSLMEFNDSDIIAELLEIKNKIEDRHNKEVSDLEIVFKGKCKECGEING